MNAHQRRVTRRAIAQAFPVGCAIQPTESGTVATITGHQGERISYKFKNGRRGSIHVNKLS